MFDRVVLGLDLGSYSIKAVELRADLRSMEFVRFEEQLLPRAASSDEIEATVESFLAERELPLEYLVGALPTEDTLFDRDDVFRVLRFRDEERIFCRESSREGCESFQEHMEIFGDLVFPPLQFASDVFEIEVEASYGETRACVSRVIDRSGVEVRTLAYRLEC